MTTEEKECVERIRSEDADLKAKEAASKRLGELLEETFILDLLPSKMFMAELRELSTDRKVPVSVKRKLKTLLKKYGGAVR